MNVPEARRRGSWRLRMAYTPEYIQRHHPVWHEEMMKKKVDNEELASEIFVAPHAQIDTMAAD